MKPSDSSVPIQTGYRYVRSRHALIISRIAYNSYLQVIAIGYYLQYKRHYFYSFNCNHLLTLNNEHLDGGRQPVEDTAMCHTRKWAVIS
jgi:hypothetical protein